MNPHQDPIVRALDEVVHLDAVVAAVAEALSRVRQQLEVSTANMAWDVVPLSLFGADLPKPIRSCWIFVIRAGAATGAERHPNSHQRSFSLIGDGRFELFDGSNWRSQALTSVERGRIEERWVSIRPSTWHRLFVGSTAWGMLSFHTVSPEELIEERPVDPEDLTGETHQERYTDRH